MPLRSAAVLRRSRTPAACTRVFCAASPALCADWKQRELGPRSAGPPGTPQLGRSAQAFRAGHARCGAFAAPCALAAQRRRGPAAQHRCAGRACAAGAARASPRSVRDAAQLAPAFARIDASTQATLRRLLAAYRTHRVGAHHFAGVEGYGHGDLGREVIDAVFASLFDCEQALVRPQFVSGTHAIAAALFGVLRPGDELLSVTGRPYDTLEEVIGLRRAHHQRAADTGSLRDFGISYRELDLSPLGLVQFDAIQAALRPQTRMVLVQRSCGYALRPSLAMHDIARIVQLVKHIRPDIVLFVDNCYGELVLDIEPTHPSVGADIVAGSLIKNCGGTIMPTGGYVAGKARYVKLAQNRMAAPGVEGAASMNLNKALLQGLFLSPQMVGEALKGALLVAQVMSDLGFHVSPAADAARSDIIQAVRLGERDKLIAFCRAVQRQSPVGAYILPEPGQTPGYGDEVIFADGTFVDGSTLELSADGPLREPYVVYAQGGTHWTHWALVLEDALQEMGLA
ncbi:protein YnbB [Porphyridium purpureum]|uniref:Protein YnbB n=1 Tax=Porphyridium purpureum TaxID=35688 RepID=A0A5J4YQR6_PORPP|nr:protein YnbB [Porphyridium purpureum]|eukprot:POR7692..scf236_6